MISAKAMFYEERSDETYEEVMNWENRKPKAELTAIEKLNKSNQAVIDARLKLAELELTHSGVIEAAAEEWFAFHNKNNIRLAIVHEMARNNNMAFFYASEFTDSFFYYGKYQGESNHYGKLIRNPFFDWEGEEGKRARHSEKFYNRKYNS